MIDKSEIISKHLPYEIEMLRYAYKRLQSPLTEVENNVYIECFCIHARNLLDFFCGKKDKYKRFAVAREFASDSYKPFDGVNPKARKEYGKLNSQTVHLTYDRTDVTEDKLDHKARADLKNRIEKEIDNFGNHLQDRFHDLWQYKGEFPLYLPNFPNSTTTTSFVTLLEPFSFSPNDGPDDPG